LTYRGQGCDFKGRRTPQLRLHQRRNLHGCYGYRIIASDTFPQLLRESDRVELRRSNKRDGVNLVEMHPLRGVERHVPGDQLLKRRIDLIEATRNWSRTAPATR
jgi:hypothetical protein